MDFDELIAEVATPGGLNEQFARHLREAGALDAVEAGMDGVLARLRLSIASRCPKLEHVLLSGA